MEKDADVLQKEAAAQRAAALHRLLQAEHDARASGEGPGTHLTSGAAAVRPSPCCSPVLACTLLQALEGLLA